jgi:hypothetical protein
MKHYFPVRWHKPKPKRHEPLWEIKRHKPVRRHKRRRHEG